MTLRQRENVPAERRRPSACGCSEGLVEVVASGRWCWWYCRWRSGIVFHDAGVDAAHLQHGARPRELRSRSEVAGSASLLNAVGDGDAIPRLGDPLLRRWPSRRDERSRSFDLLGDTALFAAFVIVWTTASSSSHLGPSAIRRLRSGDGRISFLAGSGRSISGLDAPSGWRRCSIAAPIGLRLATGAPASALAIRKLPASAVLPESSDRVSGGGERPSCCKPEGLLTPV